MRPMMMATALLASVMTLSASALAADGAPTKKAQTAPSGYVGLDVLGVVPTGDSNTLLLTDANRQRVLPIGIGNTEALSIHLRLEKRKFDRPLTHDLLDQVLRQLGGKITKVHIDALKDGVFHGRIFLSTKRGPISIDARPSDACALAVGNAAPIFVSDKVMTEAAILTDDLMPDQEEAAAPGDEGPRLLDL